MSARADIQSGSIRMKKIICLWILLGLGMVEVSRGEAIVALLSGNRLLFFDSATPGAVTKSFTVTTVSGETLVAIDFRPSTGDLYAMGDSGRLYILNLTTNAASITPNAPPGLNGSRFGFDFNPVVDIIRVTSNFELNLRLNPTTGAEINTDTALNYPGTDVHAGVNPTIVGCAYTNNF